MQNNDMKLTRDYIQKFTVPELDYFRRMCNFTAEERCYFDLKSVDYSNVQIAMEMHISESTVSKLARKVKSKIIRVI